MRMIDLVLGKKDMLRYVQDVRAVISDHHVVLFKVRLVDGARSIRSEKLRDHQYIRRIY